MQLPGNSSRLDMKKHAWNLYERKRFKEAIIAFNQLSDLTEDWKALQALGDCYGAIGNYRLAIETFFRSLSLDENWITLCGIGDSLVGVNEFHQSLKFYKRSLIVSNSDVTCAKKVYQSMARAYQLLEEDEKQKRSIEVVMVHSDLNPIKRIDPLCGKEDKGIEVGSKQLQKLNASLARKGYEFYSSLHKSDANHSVFSGWSNILYLHIPKCAGTSYILPLNTLFKALAENIVESNKIKPRRQYFISGNIQNDFHANAICKSFLESCSPEDEVLSGLFLAPHGIEWKKLSHLFKGGVNNKLKSVCLLRRPDKRLMSQIKMLASHSETIDELRSAILREEHNFDNTLSRYITDKGLKRVDLNKYDNGSQPIHNDTYGMIFLDIEDTQPISQVKSAFLSSCNLPNLIQPKVLNKNAHGSFPSTPKDYIHEVYSECLDNGYINEDEKIYRECLNLKQHVLDIDPFCLNRRHFLHPLTFVFNGNRKYSIELTKNIIHAEPGEIGRFCIQTN